MTDHRFDDLTKALGANASRRGVLKALAAATLAGVLTRAGGDDAAAFRGRRGCARLSQDCGGTNPGCCVGLTCGEDDICCTGDDQPCVADIDCCGDNVCRPFGPFSYHCQAPGAGCRDDRDCVGELRCDAYSSLCVVDCQAAGEICLNDNECCSGVCAPISNRCVAGCLDDGGQCASDIECCSGACDFENGRCAASEM